MDYAREVGARLRAAGLRMEIDESNEKLGAKIRTAQLSKIPYMLVVGEKEQSTGTVSLRKRSGGDQGSVAVEEFLAEAKKQIETRALSL